MNEKTEVKIVRLIKQIGADVDWKKPANKQLIAGILALKNEDETRRFLRDLMTPGEITEFGKRLETACLLSQDVQYNAISENTGLSSATIARIAKWLDGSLGGYRLIISRLSKFSNHHSPSRLRKGLYFFDAPKLKA